MIDREIRHALNVDPSPEFVARVRTRIANEPPPSAWRWSWMLAAAGALAAALAVAVVASRPGQKAIPQPYVADSFRPADTAQKTRETEIRPPALAVLPMVSSSRQIASPPPREPEAFIDPREARAIRTFIENSRRGRLDFTAAADTAPPVMEAQHGPDIYIAPIEFEPLTAINGDKGVPQ